MLTAYNSINLPGLYLAINYGMRISLRLFLIHCQSQDMKDYLEKKSHAYSGGKR